jgi:phospho-N-acetylmuramoyl-pentapeptide-transferase
MLHHLSQLESVWGPFRLFDYLSVRMILAGVTALVLGLALAPAILRRLAALRQPERDARLMGDLAKEGGKVPTMGGLLIAAAMLPSALLWVKPSLPVLAALVCLLGMGALGLWDDWLKVRRGNADGISARTKLAGQLAVAALAFGLLLASPALRVLVAQVWVPGLSEPVWPAAGVPAALALLVAGGFFALVGVGASNAVNLTDGLDGLAAGCVLSVTLVLGVVAYLAGDLRHAEYLRLAHVPGAGELGVLCCALAGGTLVFLWHNAAPAEVYMGDVGALGIGGFLGAVACLIHQPFLLAVAGGVFVLEALSVLLQVAWYRRTGGRRLFLMAPIHHHFQRLGWPATKVVVRFWILSFLFGLLGLLTLKLR